MTIALHTCCAPCLIEPLESLAAEDDVVVVFANPNIAPEDECVRRREALKTYASRIDVRVVELPYDPDRWRAAVAGLEDDQPARCAACYRVRLKMTARWAAEHGIEALATTLTVSPHQSAAAIREAGEEAAAAEGLTYLHRDFRGRYPSATGRARELGLYRQDYCGCLFSKREAEARRAARRARRTTRTAQDGVREGAAPAGRRTAVDA